MVGAKVALGALWLVGAKVSARALDLVSMLVVARLLAPADFGLFALAASVLLILDALTDLSLANAIVQMRDPQKPIYDTAFTLNLMRGVALSLLVVATAVPFATLYEDQRLVGILYALAVIPLIRGLVSPRLAHLQRELDFKPQFYIDLLSTICTFTVSVTIALLTGNYWALVVGMVATPTIATIMSYRFAPYRPAINLVAWRPILSFSGWLTLGNGVNTLNLQADRFFIGGWLGTGVLGTYTVGNTLASLPTNAPIMPIMQALYAGFAKLSDDLPRLRSAYLTSQAIMLALALPIALAVAVFAQPIILTFMGPDWAGSIVVVQILAPVLALQMLTAPAHSIAMVTNRTNELFKRDLLMLAVRLALIVLGMYLAGFTGILYARVLSGLFIIWQNMLMVRRIIDVPVWRQASTAWRSYVSGLVYAAFLFAAASHWGLLEQDGAIGLVQIALLTSVGWILYACIHLGLWAAARPSESAEGRILKLLGLKSLRSLKLGSGL